MVKVAGLSNAFRIDLDDVLVKAEDMYHMTHSMMSCQDNGAFKASAIS